MDTTTESPAHPGQPWPGPSDPPSSSPEKSPADTGHAQTLEPQNFAFSWRIGSIIAVFCLLSFIAALDSTVITTSLPTISREIGGEELYAWIANSYLFVSTAPQPFIAQMSNVFGRKTPMMLSIVLFALGSGIGGGARNPAMLITGRVVQGLGSAGLYVLAEIVICDLVPPRFRAPYLSAVLSTAVLGTTVGPIIGGAIVEANWRWIFWLNLPVSGIALLAILLVLKVGYRRSPTWKSALLRVDFLGSLIFIPAMIAIFLGLINGGVEHPWGSWQTILPLVLGILGWIAFHLHQSSKICKEPTMPSRLFRHRTSTASFLIIFLCAIAFQAVSYFLPVYFMAAKGTSPLVAGVYFLPCALAVLPFGGVTGFLLLKFGRYRPLHFVGFAMCAVGSGLLSLLDESSSTAAWVCYQMILSGGVGIIFTASLPSALAPLDEADVAVATGTYSFIRTFGLLWGVTIAAILFNGQMNAHLDSVRDPVTRGLLENGAAYAYASGNFIPSLEAGTRSEVIGVYVTALKVVWYVMAAISSVGFLCVTIEKHVPLRQEHKTEYGLEGDSAKDKDLETNHRSGGK